MECEEVQRLLDGYVDGELDVVKSLDIEHHLGGCRSCAESFKAYETLRRELRNEFVYAAAPPTLRNRIRAAVLRETRQAAPFFGRIRTWQAIAAILLVALVGSWSVMVRSSSGPADRLADEILSNHIRSLMAGHLTDVVSGDQHTVKPWFDGKLDFSPPVPDLASSGFVLVGGRQEYIAGRQVAALVYRRRNHIINAYTWYSQTPDRVFSTQTHQGYNIIDWSGAGKTWWAVSDLNAGELSDFCRLVEGQK